MKELKTLKDLRFKANKKSIVNQELLDLMIKCYNEILKQEAVKWVKELREQDKKWNDNQNEVSIAHFIDFFNITGEDLK